MDDLGQHAEARVVVDAGDHAQHRAVFELRAVEHVDLPQLHGL